MRGNSKVGILEKKVLECLDRNFPQFAHLVAAGQGNPVEQTRPPASEEAIEKLEIRLGIPLPNTYKEFLRCVGGVRLRGGIIQFSPGHPFFHQVPAFEQLMPQQREQITQRGGEWPPPSQGMLCIAEFFLEGDGDQVLFDVKQGLIAGEYPVVYYAHDAPASVRQLAASFPEFLEQCLTYFD